MAPQIDRPRILVIGQGVKPTGFARVLESIMGHLHRRFAFHHFAMNWTGAPPPRPWVVHPNRIPGDPFGTAQIPALLDQIRPDLVFINHHYWLYPMHRDALARRARTVLYCPVDGVLARPEDLRELAGLDCLVAYSRFGASQLRRVFAPSGAGVAPPLRVIPHGVDTDAFHPLDGGAAAARRALLPDRSGLDRAFVVLNANRNGYRKRLDTTIVGFDRFARGKPAGVKLWLHAPYLRGDPALDRVYDRLCTEDRILHTPVAPGASFPAVSDAALNRIYNACDVGLNSSSGEGWGLVSFEHAATGAAQVVPAHTTCAELWRGRGVLVEPVSRECPPVDYVEHHAVSAEGVARALEGLYADRAALARHARACYARATEPRYRWDRIAERWALLFHDVLDDRLAGD